MNDRRPQPGPVLALFTWPYGRTLVPLRPDWLQGELFEHRVVFVAGRLDSGLAMRAAAELMTLDASGSDPVDVYLDSPDGTLEAASTLTDTLDLLVAPTHIHVLGEVGGPVVGVLAAGRRRTAAPHASFRLAEPVLQVSGTTGQMLAWGQQQRLLLRRFRERIARATRRPIAEIAEDLQQGRYLDAAAAMDYGLVHDIADPSVTRHSTGGG
jgi:ATP-dependent Clp protease protease subunit